MLTYQRIHLFNACRTIGCLMMPVLLLVAGNNPAFAAQAPKGTPKHVIVAPVVLKEISDRVEALGTARARESVNITANVSEKIEQIRFEDGQHARAGEILVVLNQAEEQANLKRAQAARGERKLALDRLLQLEERKLAATDEIDRTRLELEQAEASIAAIQAQISDRVIRAPFDGVVGLRDISIGALVETGDLIATLDDTSQIKLDFSVPTVFLSELKPGLKIKARASALGNRVFLGEVKSIDSRVDPVTRSVQVRAILPNPDGRILPGLLMQVDLLRNTRQAMVIPEAALLPLANKQYVMVRVSSSGKDTVEKREVQIGIRTPGYVEILGGLNADDQVVTHGNSKVHPGDSLDVLAVDDGSVDIATIIEGQNGEGQ